MNRIPDEDPQDLAGQYVLGTLPASLRRDVEGAMPRDAALKAAVEEWEARLLPLTDLVQPEEPSAQLWPRIARSVAARRAAGTTRKGAHTRWWDSLWLWRALATAGLAAAIVLATVPLRPTPAPAPRYMVVLAAPGSMSPGWILQSSDDGRLHLQPLGPATVPEARALQLWTKADGWKGPVSLGLVEAGKAVDVPIDRLPPLQPNQLFEITLEPPAGSPLGRPTGPILFIGRAVKLI